MAFPEVDIRKRLTISSGYGVAELHVREGADLVGQTIDGSGLRDKDITILTPTRGTNVIPTLETVASSSRKNACSASQTGVDETPQSPTLPTKPTEGQVTAHRPLVGSGGTTGSSV